ncbi:hypothetical protein BV898_06942 [Hypsibius exemplaris]|uniref:PBZ-type domain-containing protein n=1 Tax=Hypsibius exemplaris TaxID=2072580 RepID=A0A1W0WV51_HYPEX|nr:hypothetical protein BV898_06942 [Hypsibius exemplaris]
MSSRTSYTPDIVELPHCPYGASCYRLNSQHFMDYVHPEGHKRSAAAVDSDPVEASSNSKASPRSPGRQAKKLKRSLGDDSSSSFLSGKNDSNLSANLCESIGLYLTTARGIDAHFNDAAWTCDFKKILAPEMGNLQTSVQFNYMFDIPGG